MNDGTVEWCGSLVDHRGADGCCGRGPSDAGRKMVGIGSALGWIGKLPGDLSITREQFSVYIPLATSLLLSLLVSLVLYILSWLFRR